MSEESRKDKQIQVANPLVPDKWDYEADVVVVGFGGAGAAAAISAHDLGAQVLLLEKAPESKAGGNTITAGGEAFSHQDIPSAIEYLIALNGPYTVPEDMIEVWAHKMKDNGIFMREALGCESVTWKKWEEFPELPGVLNAGGWTAGKKPSNGWGKDLYELFKSNVIKRDINVWYEAPGKKLIQDPVKKEIIGVIVEKAGDSIYVKAKKAVVLTCGGFENNQEMHKNYLPVPYVYPIGTPYNTGDGIKMALAVGADLWHMNNLAGPLIGFKTPEIPVILNGPPPFKGIRIGPDGKRFMNEMQHSRHGKILLNGIWVPTPTPLPMHAIFDETVRLGGPFNSNRRAPLGWANVMKIYSWSRDNSIEIEKGWIIQADNIRELAMKINIDPEVLEETKNEFNRFCKTGEDLDFGRPESTLNAIDTPPYYAMEMSPGILNTQGGPRRNKHAQILDTEGNPILRLYSAGELGSMYSYCYNGGGNLGEAIAFGRIAGENASALSNWD